jgi:molybdopterin-containing oxidoreductase family membrane subunit
MVITLTIPIRKIFALEDYITLDNYDGMAKMIILTSLIVGYAYGSSSSRMVQRKPRRMGQFYYRATGQCALYWMWSCATC